MLVALLCGIAGTGLLAWFGFPATYISTRFMGFAVDPHVKVLSWIGVVLLGGSFVLQMIALIAKK